jgi:tRNA pseudouridine38-40 synthase
MVGALLSVGEAGRPVSWPAEILGGRVRDSSVQVAAAHGLTLVGVDYPEADGLLARVAEARRRRRSSSSRFHE